MTSNENELPDRMAVIQRSLNDPILHSSLMLWTKGESTWEQALMNVVRAKTNKFRFCQCHLGCKEGCDVTT